MSAIPNFGEVAQTENNYDAAESETQEGTTAQTLDLTEGEVENYTAYEAIVDVGRYASALRKETGDDRYDEVVEWALEKKEALREECKEQPGNLPMFRAAFPVEDRSDDVWVLPKDEAAAVGIDYDSEDYIALPVYDGTKWHPTDVVGTEPVESGNDADDEETVQDGEPKPETEAQKRVVKGLDKNPEADAETVAELVNSSEGWVTNFAKKFRPDHPAAVVDDTGSSDDDVVEAVETAEADSVEEAKVEALKALTKTLNKTAEVIESL